MDTHVWAWGLKDERRLSRAARDAIEQADTRFLSVISFFEIAQKVRIGKWPDMSDVVNDLPAVLDQQSGVLAPIDGPISLRAGLLEWEHRDPFDRMIAATAMARGLTLISADAAFDAVVKRIW
jgi:PIN domain nuclease of toxin-antitoxin system